MVVQLREPSQALPERPLGCHIELRHLAMLAVGARNISGYQNKEQEHICHCYRTLQVDHRRTLRLESGCSHRMVNLASTP